MDKQPEVIYAYRRKGLGYFCTCDKEQYTELADKPHLFEVTVFYTAPPSKPDDLLRQSEQEGWRWAKECEAEVKRLKECLFQMQNAAADLSKKNQELVEALEGLDEAYCRAGSPLNKQERHEDRMRLIVARRVIAKHKEQA